MNRTGPRNLITDVAGICVGNAEDPEIRSGVTLVLPDAPAVGAVDCRGGGPGTRETDALSAESSVTHIHGVVLSGGSAFGLDAASGAMAWLAGQGRGFEIAGQIVPIVPAAILFDLANGGDKSWATQTLEGSPYRRMGVEAAQGVAGLITPHRRGVGPMTITMLLHNTLLAYKSRNRLGS